MSEIVKLSPRFVQIKGKDTVMLKVKGLKSEKAVNIDTLLVLSVLIFMSWFYYGWRVVIVTLISVASAYISDIICVKLCGKKYEKDDLSAVVGGVLMALMMPASVPYHIVILANIFAITLGKQFFGGKEHNIFNPVIVGYLLSAICWKDLVLKYPKPEEMLPLTSAVENPLSVSLTQTLTYAPTPSNTIVDIVLGKFYGPMGTTHIFLILICACILSFRHSTSGLTFFCGTVTIAVLAYLYPAFGITRAESVFYELSSGTVLFSLLFFAGDYYTVPKTISTRIVYGVLIGVVTVLFQRLGNTENAILYAILISNPIAISLDDNAFSFRKLWDEIVEDMKASKTKTVEKKK
ncbi:MAG: hypothetical protein E7507_00455 [Ruminococcus sp.]|nr:hypothetical protein [Ruminococcus sp.]